jgi:aspartate beta-hydroxylase
MELNKDYTSNTSEIQNLSFSSEDKENFLYSKLKVLFSDYLLSEIQSMAAFKFIKDKFLSNSTDAEHVKKWVLMKINNKSLPDVYDKMQLGCPDLVPGLTIKNFWDPREFSWIGELVSNINTIKEELIELRNTNGFQPYKSPAYASDIKSKDNLGSYAHDKGEWNVFYLFLHDLKFEDNCAKCPKTVDLIQKLVPRQY